MRHTRNIKINVLLSFGSNLGDRRKNIEKALEILLHEGAGRLIDISKFYETEPVGFLEQPWFLNAAALLETELSLSEFYRVCKQTEIQIGRKERPRWHEREIDIDILLFGSEIIKSEMLTVPHPRMHERRFVLEPAAEIAHDAIHPVLNLSVKTLFELCRDEAEVLPE